jgi:hypothetical protein
MLPLNCWWWCNASSARTKLYRYLSSTVCIYLPDWTFNLEYLYIIYFKRSTLVRFMTWYNSQMIRSWSDYQTIWFADKYPGPNGINIYPIISNCLFTRRLGPVNHSKKSVVDDIRPRTQSYQFCFSFLKNFCKRQKFFYFPFLSGTSKNCFFFGLASHLHVKKCFKCQLSFFRNFKFCTEFREFFPTTEPGQYRYKLVQKGLPNFG